MKTLNFVLILALSTFLNSCGETETREAELEADVITEISDSDEVIEDWGEAWNSNDPSRVREMTAPDAILVINGIEYPQDSIPGFIDWATSTMKDLQMHSLKKGSSENLAYDAGTFTHTYTTDTTKYVGAYTFVWERSYTNDGWKVKVMNISEANPW